MLFLNYHFLNIVFLNIAILKHWFFKYTITGGGGQNNQGPGLGLPSSFTPYFDCVKLLFQSDINISPDRESLSESKYRLYTVSIGTKKRVSFWDTLSLVVVVVSCILFVPILRVLLHRLCRMLLWCSIYTLCRFPLHT